MPGRLIFDGFDELMKIINILSIENIASFNDYLDEYLQYIINNNLYDENHKIKEE
jgi:hypothetical protein